METVSTLADQATVGKIIKNGLSKRPVQLMLLTLLISGILTMLTPNFLAQSNLKSVAMGMTYDLIVALGMTYVLIIGGLDLSVGSNIAITSVVTTLLLKNGVAIPIAILAGLATSMIVGGINGFFITKCKMNPFIVTLGTMSLARGAAMTLTSGYFVTSLPKGFLILGRGEISGIPFPVIFAIILVIVFSILLNRFAPLNRGFYVGAHPNNAELVGINVGRTIFTGFVICGLFSGIAAIFMCSRLAMGYAQFGLEMELRALAAAVIGGAGFSGGRGSVWGTFFGVLLLAIINNGFILMDASIYWQKVVNGTILIVAIATAVRNLNND
ncbi:MAG: ABC transporter permease [SAR324 cluster bacterium]|nr:ABC transporter permease [SAR324 cluster bacterium]